MEALTDEHRMLQDSLEGILARTTDPQALWPQLAELGMLGLALPESAGGAGLGLREVLLFSRLIGRSGLPVPYVAAEVMAAPLLAELVAQPAVAPRLRDVLNGSLLVTLAFDGAAQVVASPVNDGYRLTGPRRLVKAGAAADIVLIAAVTNGIPAIFMIDMHTAGLRRTPYLPLTPEAGAELTLDGVMLPFCALLCKGEDAIKLISAAQARGQIGTAANMLGAMEALLDLTVDHLRTRHQFGQPLAAFQVLQHAAVDMYVEIETARAMLDYGLGMIMAPEPARDQALDAVKFKMNQAAKLVGENAVQLHGGIGMTEESLTGRLFARLTALRVTCGDSRACLSRLLAAENSLALN